MLVTLWLRISVALKAKLDRTLVLNMMGVQSILEVMKRKLPWAWRLLKDSLTLLLGGSAKGECMLTHFIIHEKQWEPQGHKRFLEVFPTSHRDNWKVQVTTQMVKVPTWCQILGNTVRNRPWTSNFSLFRVMPPATSLIKNSHDPMEKS